MSDLVSEIQIVIVIVIEMGGAVEAEAGWIWWMVESFQNRRTEGSGSGQP